jgi:hypothetical protein
MDDAVHEALEKAITELANKASAQGGAAPRSTRQRPGSWRRPAPG